MSTQAYILNEYIYVGGEQADNSQPAAIFMSTGDYGSYDNSSLKFSLYPSAGAYGVILYVPLPVVASMVSTGVIGTTAGLTGSLPTPH